ncbi:Exonuclease DPD1, chloroplastic/mitochondrial [Arabidopsis thaliana]|uniref:DPD1 n=2 Tax=Arabidopsis TaxID=3701 RepID=A0A178USW0_ARATH|nr:Ribonuclease H-like superfamily [Arabidopsis thaliana x Arabidopsis arenosa]KAG7603598.1 Ribonuclease H-like superfamily [Arabidopsis thaliana x Arabidopsis arenosa]OAO96407.1 DPD1 [Arabidopsis thaliana]
MCVSISQVSRLRIHSFGSSCCERVHGWIKNSSSLKLLDVRASSVDGKARWIRRNVSTTTQGSRSNTKSSVLGGTVPVTRIIDEKSRTKVQPFGNLQQRLAQDKDLSKLLTVIVSDLETTGLHRKNERIIEIAAQDIAGGGYSTFQTLVNPGVVPITNAHIHGIRNDMVCRPEVPRMEELIPIFLRYVESRQKPGGYVMLVAHNGKSFDFQFLINEFNRCSYEIPHNWLLLDSLPLARENMKSVEPTVKLSSSLEALADYYSLTREGDAHRALSDVLLLSKVFQKLTIDLKLSLSDLVLRCHTASDISAAMAKNKKA